MSLILARILCRHSAFIFEGFSFSLSTFLIKYSRVLVYKQEIRVGFPEKWCVFDESRLLISEKVGILRCGVWHDVENLNSNWKFVDTFAAIAAVLEVMMMMVVVFVVSPRVLFWHLSRGLDLFFFIFLLSFFVFFMMISLALSLFVLESVLLFV